MKDLKLLYEELKEAHKNKDRDKLLDLMSEVIVSCLVYEPTLANLMMHKKIIDFLDSIDIDELMQNV